MLSRTDNRLTLAYPPVPISSGDRTCPFFLILFLNSCVLSAGRERGRYTQRNIQQESRCDTIRESSSGAIVRLPPRRPDLLPYPEELPSFGPPPGSPRSANPSLLAWKRAGKRPGERR
ncbi:hypothetical protein GGS23DRAFT_413367 [Durotheca rogersii]|uniref:uncharacterized protein n=1 Tax=Durotheca rogersii TaxID=419775 RepID=UPI00221E931B|nr:uncharacterized protein GGS23DRAFT_413367 [Durotheca rogersii]KAI5865187.1 hypothetical protein GGS23DRAFT_413367 [Durotheca rogersii]